MGEAARSSTMRAIGLMSGTSLDGIDIAVVDTDGGQDVLRGPCTTVAYPQAFRTRLVSAIQDARKLEDRRARPGCLADVERELTERHAAAVNEFLAAQGIEAAERRGGRLPRTDRAASSRRAADRSTRRRSAAGEADRHRRYPRPARCRLRWPAVKARRSFRSTIARSSPSCRSARSLSSTSAASPTSPTSAPTDNCWRSIPVPATP